MLHDFAVTEKHIAFLAVPLVADMEQMKAGGLHYSWDAQQPSYFGVLERGADGKDMRWYPGPTMMCTHVMGAWSEGSRIFVDMDGADGNQFPFFPNKHNDPHTPVGQIRRFSVDLADAAANSFDMEVLFPEVMGVLARQDDRFHTLPYRYGYMLEIAAGGKVGWAMVDHQKGEVRRWAPGENSSCSEMCFVPRSKDAPEGDGYLIGVVHRASQHNRSDVVLIDTSDIEAGPIATIKLPYRIAAQVHGFWAFADDFKG
jgi:carotenoid cleavage dioxygenase